jgi:hypothetical protein
MKATPRGFDTAPILRFAAPLAVLGWLGLLLGLQAAPQRVYFGYLVAFSGSAAIVLGALLFLMTCYVVRARWNVVIRPLNEAVVSTLAVLPLLFVPLVLGLSRIYPWASPSPGLSESELALLHHKQRYLNAEFFTVRSALYFLIWGIAAILVTRKSRARSARREQLEDDDAHRDKRLWSAVFLPWVGLSSTFAAFDWLMSLQPFWQSSIFGVYYFAGGFVASFGLLSLLAWRGLRSGRLSGLVGPAHFHALGRLMFGFSSFWAYIAYFQTMLIRMANLPSEVSFYSPRSSAGWGALLWLVVAMRFVVPFFVLLPRSVKHRPALVGGLGLLLVAGEFVDAFWLVMPASGNGPLRVTVWDAAALLAVLGTLTSYAAWRSRGVATAPLEDPDLQHSITYRSPS